MRLIRVRLPSAPRLFAGAWRIIAGFMSLLAVLLAAASSPGAGATASHGPVRLVAALDASESLQADDSQGLGPQAAALLVHLLEEGDSLALLRFAAAPAVLLEPGPLTPARRRLGLQRLARLDPQGESADLPAVLDAALEIFSAMPPAPRRVLALITPGRLNPDLSKSDAAARQERLQQVIIPAYQRAHIAIYAAAPSSALNHGLLRHLAAATGGDFFPSDRPAGLHHALFRLYERLKEPQLAPVIDRRFSLDQWVDQMTLLASREAPEQPVGLTDPLGRQLTPKNAGRQVRWFATPAFDLVTISQPRPGVWSLSGCQGEANRVALSTDLRLACPEVPAEVGSDEELVVGAAVFDRHRPLSLGLLLEHWRFEAQLGMENTELGRVELGPPSAAPAGVWPHGLRVGRLPPSHTPGAARLRVRVLGQTFLRERNFSVRVTGPWYRKEIAAGSSRAPKRLAFLPTAKGPPREVQGWISLQPAWGGLAARLFKPPAPGAFSLAMPLKGPPPRSVDLLLMGVSASGRPLVIRPDVPSFRLGRSDGAAPSPAAFGGKMVEKLRGLALPGRRPAGMSKKNPWLLAALAAWLVVFVGVVLRLSRGRWPLLHRIPTLGSRNQPAGGASPPEKLIWLARLEALGKEKDLLLGELDQAAAKLRQAEAEEAELLQKVEQQSLEGGNQASGERRVAAETCRQTAGDQGGAAGIRGAAPPAQAEKGSSAMADRS